MIASINDNHKKVHTANRFTVPCRVKANFTHDMEGRSYSQSTSRLPQHHSIYQMIHFRFCVAWYAFLRSVFFSLFRAFSFNCSTQWETMLKASDKNANTLPPHICECALALDLDTQPKPNTEPNQIAWLITNLLHSIKIVHIARDRWKCMSCMPMHLYKFDLMNKRARLFFFLHS